MNTISHDTKMTQQSFLQSSFWAKFKSYHGWRVQKITLQDGSEINVFLRTFFRFFTIAYIPLAPQFTDMPFFEHIKNQPDYFSKIMILKTDLQNSLPKNLFCIRFDPPLEYDFDTAEPQFFTRLLKQTSVKKSLVDIQPPDSVILDLTQPQETLLENMKSKWRYNIRLAEKKGVTIRKASSDDLGIFYDLYKQTAKRDGIAIHKEQYYKDLLVLSEKNDSPTKIFLYIAEHENEPLAAIIVLHNQSEAVYLYGASANKKRNLMPAYLLQWTAIKEAQASGCLYYDFYGIPPSDDENHPMHGLYRFKTGFGGRIIHRLGSFDLPISILYFPFTIVEKLRAFWFKKMKKLFLGR
ncbi:MAG: lipid II:glycine glycyltransferase FemX [Treponemataceae bacterium]